MTCSLEVVRRVALVGAVLLLLVSGCGDDASGDIGDGCSTDVECKGDRICIDGACVDPSAEDPDSGTSNAGEGGAGEGGAGEGGESGEGGAGEGGGGSGGSPVVDDPELEQACTLDCEARHAASCEMNIGSLDQCRGQCLVIDETNRYCHDEQRNHYACLASGGYECISGYPQQQATCASEALALSECSQLAPCRMFCERAAGDCAPSGEECVTECRATQASFDDAICGIYYGQLLACWSTAQDFMCNGDQPAVGSCGPQVSEIADCIGRRNTECDGYCWAAEALGCGSDDCLTDCTAKYDDASCGSYYRSVIDCATQSYQLNMTCEDGEPTPSATECASQLMQHTMCTDGI